MTTFKIQAGDLFPVIELDTLEGTKNLLGQAKAPFEWKMVLVYRGKHCPLCTRYLNELNALSDAYREQGIDIIAVSADSKEQALAQTQELALSFPIGFNLSVENMQQLGLYISQPRTAQETDHLFAEPALFIINTDGKVQIVDISNAPFARPDLNTLLNGIKFIRDPNNNYPIRGTYSY